MSFVSVKVMEEASMPTGEKEIVVALDPSWSWADIESLLSAEWEIGGSATPADLSRALVAGE